MNNLRVILRLGLLFSLVFPFSSQGADDLDTQLPPPPNDLRTPSSEEIIQNPDGSFTFIQVIDENSTPPNYSDPGNYGFEVYSWFDQDYGWMHSFPFWNDGDLLIEQAQLTIVAWDVDSEAFHGYDGEYDGIYVDGVLLDPGYLQGNDEQWSATVFNLQMSSIIDDGYINVWCDIDMHHDEEVWATTIDYCEMRITYRIDATNTPPYEPDLAVSPQCAGNDDDLVVQVVGPDPADPNGDAVTYQFEWFVDVGTGEFIEDAFAGRGEHIGPVVPSSDTVEGDLWRVQVRSMDEHGSIGNYTTVTWSEPIGCESADLVILNAIPGSLGTSIVDASVEPESVSSGGIELNHCVTDGTSRLFLRYTADRAGTLNVQIYDLDYPGEPLGVLRPLNDTYEGATVATNTVLTSVGHQAFVVYRPPGALFSTEGYEQDTRNIKVSVIFEPEDGSANQELEDNIFLQRPPILFVHGIWSDSGKWTDSGLYGPLVSRLGTEASFVDYGGQTHIGFDSLYQNVELEALGLMLSYARSGIACTQVQVVAHSMGGLLTRTWMAQPYFSNPDNYNEGFVDMLITVDTPHFGSSFANYYSNQYFLRWLNPVCFDLMNAINPFGDSVLNMRNYSEKILALGQSQTRAHAFVGIGGSDYFAQAHGSTAWLAALPILSPVCYGTLTPPSIFGSEEHDYIVQSASQAGGLAYPFSIERNGIEGEHTEAPDQPIIAQEIERILELGSFSNRLSPDGFPAPVEPGLALTGATMGDEQAPPLIPVDPAASSRTGEIDVLSPPAGSAWHEGSTIPVEVDFGQAVSTGIMVIGDEVFLSLDPSTGQATWLPEDGVVGTFYTKVVAVSEEGTVLTSFPSQFTVLPDAPFVDFSLTTPRLVALRPGQEKQILLSGETASGQHLSAHWGSLGTTYEVSNLSIAQVNQDGLVTAWGPGVTQIAVRNGSYEDVVEVEVLYAVPNDPPVADAGGPYEFCVGEPLCLDGLGSIDIDGTPTENLGFEWDLDGDGLFDEATGPNPCVDAVSAGEITISLRVTDNLGAQDVATTSLLAQNCGPVIDGVYPGEPVPGDEVDISGRLLGPDPGPGFRSTDTHNISLGGQRFPDEEVLSWDEGGIVIRLPGSAVSGDLVVTVESVPSPPFHLTVSGGSLEQCVWVDASVEPLNNTTDGHGIAWGDIDNDGDDDLFLANAGENALLRNEGGGIFTRMPDLPWNGGDSRGAAFADYDNDGDLDLYVVNWSSPNRLYQNEGGNFTDATIAPLDCDLQGNNVAWADFDGDGDLDFVVTNFDGPNKLFRNDEGTFVIVEGTPLSFTGYSRGCAWGDYDGDMDPDLYISVEDGPNHLFRNDGGVFIDVTTSPLDDPGKGKGVAWGDYDNDGDLDLYLVNRFSANRLFRNDGGIFSILDDEVVGDEGDGRACGWGDYNNDGWLDLFVTNYSGENRLYQNLGGMAFADSTCGPLEAPISAWGMGWSDYDNDGDLDLYLSNHNWQSLPNHMFRNDLIGTPTWLQVELVGSQSNRYGVGAKIVVEDMVGQSTQMREVQSGSGYMSQPSIVSQFGLGLGGVVDVTVYWPSGIIQRIEGQSVNQRVTIAEATQATGVGEEIVPLTYSVNCYPNPFNPITNIEFSLPRDSSVSVKVFDVTGRLVQRLIAEEHYPAGVHSVLWNGTDSAGKLVASGVYFYRYQAGGYTKSGRMMLLK